jgi:hypothetical protein
MVIWPYSIIVGLRILYDLIRLRAPWLGPAVSSETGFFDRMLKQGDLVHFLSPAAILLSGSYSKLCYLWR